MRHTPELAPNETKRLRTKCAPNAAHSTPINRKPKPAATTKVEPDPAKQSKTNPPGGQAPRKARPITASGFWVEYPTRDVA